jgi:hypothetical protein
LQAVAVVVEATMVVEAGRVDIFHQALQFLLLDMEFLLAVVGQAVLIILLLEVMVVVVLFLEYLLLEAVAVAHMDLQI